MKAVKCLCLAGVLIQGVWAELMYYPHIQVTPTNPVVGDTVAVWLVKGMHSNDCVPRYEDITLKVAQEPTTIQQPKFSVEVTYDEIWPKPDRPCTTLMTEYGPRFTLANLDVGTYCIKDGDTVANVFSVTYAPSVRGIVTPDLYPLQHFVKLAPIKGAKVYLRRVYASNALPEPESNKIGSPYPIAYLIVDSTITDNTGYYDFSCQVGELYDMVFVADGFRERTLSFFLRADTTIDVRMVPDDAAGTVSGKVSELRCPSLGEGGVSCFLDPVPRCTVTAYPEAYFQPHLKAYDTLSLEDMRRGTIAYTAVTDEKGNYTIADIPLSYNRYPLRITARKAGYKTETSTVTISNTDTTIQSFFLESDYPNTASDTVDGVVFAIAADKTRYTSGDPLKVRYTITNGSMATVRYDFTSGCQFDLYVTADSGELVYHHMQGRRCTEALTNITLSPGEKEVFDFSPVNISCDSRMLQITARMIGYDRSAVSVMAEVDCPSAVSPQILASSRGPKVRWSMRTGRLVLHLDQTQDVSVEAFSLDGRRIRNLCLSRRFAAGTHAIDLNTRLTAGGVAVLRITGEHFEATKKVSLVGSGLSKQITIR
ncbi:MAG: hypothetical protein GF344_05785 [Chitinivibrionales bacterium]|nr:hypothetical protein [Chitinivibrionales bacterium]MBD3356476.1 hypothetical protein [Chitinivibrionales bacterium]